MQLRAHTFENSTGYGRWARQILAALELLGHKTWISSCIPLPEDLKHLYRDAKSDIIVYPPFVIEEAPIQFTIYESTRITPQMVKCLNSRKLVILPCQQNIRMCKDSGVKTRLALCQPTFEIKYKLPPAFNPFTFVHIGADNQVPSRKRTADVIKAFVKAFPKETDVRLIVKKDPEDIRLTCFDSRISLIYERRVSIEDIYAAAHVGVFPCGQEGWGFCQSELMARGRPVILPIFGGPEDFCDAMNSYPLGFSMVKTPKAVYGGIGECAKASFEAMVKTLRFCYENKEDTVLRGLLAYRRMTRFTMDHMVGQLAAILQ